MAEILARHTAMPVRQVEDGMAVEPDHVYVIRPGHVLTIRDGHLHLGPQLGTSRAANRPIDDFFRSLAEEQRERAVGIVMSGMGSNGTAGAQAIKAVGGLCIAQDPESAQFPSMPRHLIDAGLRRLHSPPGRHARGAAGVCRASLRPRRPGGRRRGVPQAGAAASSRGPGRAPHPHPP